MSESVTGRCGEVLGRVLYERLLRADPQPGDPEWSELSDHERGLYRAAAAVVVRHYEAAMGYDASGL